MTPFDYDAWVKRWWRNARSRYRTNIRRMPKNKMRRKPYQNTVSFKTWLIGKTIEDTYLQGQYGGHTPEVIQRMALSSFPLEAKLIARGIEPMVLYQKIEEYASKRLGVDVELVDAISYAANGWHAKPTKRFAIRETSWLDR